MHSNGAASRRPSFDERCVHELVAARAAQRPGALAVSGPDETLTYAELDERSSRLAKHLRSLGVGPNVLVGLCVERSAAMVVGALGILKAGGAYVAMDATYPAERLAYMLDDSRAPVLVTSRAQAGRLDGGDSLVVVLDGTWISSSEEPIPLTETAAGPGDLAYVIYTSGSSGRPKGVMVEHRSLLNLVRWHRRAFSITERDRATQVASPAFDATVWELWPHLTAGAAILIAPEEVRADAAAMRDWLLEQQVTITFLPTPLAEAALALPWPRSAAMRIMLTGGDALHRRPSEDMPFELVNNYGPTEGTVVSTSGIVPRDTGSGFAPTIGKPIDNVTAYVVDADLRPVDAGSVGELLIGGELLARGYLNRPELTAERFIADPFATDPEARLYRTGDLVRLRADDELEFIGRVDDQVKIRGHRIEPAEISAALDLHPAVTSSIVVARDGAAGDKRLVAYVVPVSGPVPAAALRVHLASRLPDYMVPAVFVMLEEMPVTPNGKVDRAALPEPRESRPGEETVDDGPQNELETALGAMVAELLGRQGVGRDENFFVLGGHSLLGAQLIARIRDRFDVQMPLRSLFENPTVAEMAVEVERLIVAQVDELTDEEAVRLAFNAV